MCRDESKVGCDAQVTDLRLRGLSIGGQDAELLCGLTRLQRLQLHGVAFQGRTVISKLAPLQVTPATF